MLHAGAARRDRVVLGLYPQAILDLLNTSLVHLNQVVLSPALAAAAVALVH